MYGPDGKPIGPTGPEDPAPKSPKAEERPTERMLNDPRPKDPSPSKSPEARWFPRLPTKEEWRHIWRTFFGTEKLPPDATFEERIHRLIKDLMKGVPYPIGTTTFDYQL